MADLQNITTIDELKNAIEEYIQTPRRPALTGDELQIILFKMIELLPPGFSNLPGDPYDNESLAEVLDDKLDRSDYNQHFRGRFSSLSALHNASFDPPLIAGNYAQVDEGESFPVKNYNWDLDDEEWIVGGVGSSATNTDQLPEGANNLYFTANRMSAAVIDAKKSFEKSVYVYGKTEMYFLMKDAGQVSSINSSGLENIKLKKNSSGTYSSNTTLNYSAGDKVYVSFNYIDNLNPEGTIILIGKDN